MNENDKIFEKYLFVNKKYKFWINSFYFISAIFIVIILSFEGTQYITDVGKIIKNQELLVFMDNIIPKQERTNEKTLQIRNKNVLTRDIIHEFLKPNFGEDFYLQYDYYPKDFVFHESYRKSCFRKVDPFLDSIKVLFEMDDSLVAQYREKRRELIITSVDSFRVSYINEVGTKRKDPAAKAKYKKQYSNYLNKVLLLELYRELFAYQVVKRFKKFDFNESELNQSWNGLVKAIETKNNAITPLINTPFKFPYLDLPVKLKVILIFIVPYLFFSSIYISVLKRYHHSIEIKLQKSGFFNSILPTIKDKLLFLKFQNKSVERISSYSSLFIVDLLPKLITLVIIFVLAINQKWVWVLFVLYLASIVSVTLKLKT